jgi:uncharacterized glyoxalase superfamily protein PhnB
MKDDYSRRTVIKAGAGTVLALSGAAEMANAQENKGMMMASDDLDAVEFGQSLRGMGFNLLVSDLDATLEFSKEILHATIINASEGFAVVQRSGAIWMLHADSTYHSNPLAGFVKGVEGRGQGIELRLYDLDPDKAEARANEKGYTVLAGSANKPHGLRECYILDPEGYCWVPSRALREGEE